MVRGGKRMKEGGAEKRGKGERHSSPGKVPYRKEIIIQCGGKLKSLIADSEKY